MRKLAVTEIDTTTFEHRCLHVIHVPEATDPGFYRQTVSYNAFFWSGKRRNWKPNDCLFRGLRWDEHEQELKHKFYEEAAKTVEHHGIWAFYESIGYDYKKQRYGNYSDHQK